MKLLVSLGLIAYASALHDSQCNNFITVKRSRNRRSPQGWFSDGTTPAGTTATSAGTTQVSTATSPVSTQKPTTAASTTARVSTSASQPAVATTTERDSTTVSESFDFSTADPVEGEGTDYLILLDATGSMQKLSGPGRGRDFVINKFNLFLKTLRKQVESQRIEDGKIVIATFNKGANWVEYNSIKNVEDLSRRTYNPGYGTNLYDTMGCALQKFKDESGAAQKLVYILTDGNHQVYPNTVVAHTVDEVNELVESYREEEGMQFSFMAMINKEDKEALKQSAKQMGIRGAEIRTTDFDGRSFPALLKSMMRSIKKGNAQKKVPTCQSLKQKCKKGRPGKSCRRAVQRQRASGSCSA